MRGSVVSEFDTGRGADTPRHRRDSEKERWTSYSSLTHRVGKPPVRICLHADGARARARARPWYPRSLSAFFVITAFAASS